MFVLNAMTDVKSLSGDFSQRILKLAKASDAILHNDALTMLNRAANQLVATLTEFLTKEKRVGLDRIEKAVKVMFPDKLATELNREALKYAKDVEADEKRPISMTSYGTRTQHTIVSYTKFCTLFPDCDGMVYDYFTYVICDVMSRIISQASPSDSKDKKEPITVAAIDKVLSLPLYVSVKPSK